MADNNSFAEEEMRTAVDSNDKKNSLEFTVKQIELQILRSFRKTASKSKRPEWVSIQIRMGVIVVLESLIETIRLKCYGNLSVSNQAEAIDYQDILSSEENETIDLDRLDQELKLDSAQSNQFHSASSASAVSKPTNNSAASKMYTSNIDVYSDSLLDLLRTCILIRTELIPRLWRDVNLRFPLSQEIIGSEDEFGFATPMEHTTVSTVRSNKEGISTNILSRGLNFFRGVNTKDAISDAASEESSSTTPAVEGKQSSAVSNNVLHKILSKFLSIFFKGTYLVIFITFIYRKR